MAQTITLLTNSKKKPSDYRIEARIRIEGQLITIGHTAEDAKKKSTDAIEKIEALFDDKKHTNKSEITATAAPIQAPETATTTSTTPAIAAPAPPPPPPPPPSMPAPIINPTSNEPSTSTGKNRPSFLDGIGGAANRMQKKISDNKDKPKKENKEEKTAIKSPALFTGIEAAMMMRNKAIHGKRKEKEADGSNSSNSSFS